MSKKEGTDREALKGRYSTDEMVGKLVEEQRYGKVGWNGKKGRYGKGSVLGFESP